MTNGIFAFFASGARLFSVPTITEILPLTVRLADKISFRQWSSFVTNIAIFFPS